MNTLEENVELAIVWFETNFMKLNKEKCEFILSGFKNELHWINVGDKKIWETKNVKLLGMLIEQFKIW